MTMRPLFSTVLAVCTAIATLSSLPQDAKAKQTLAFEREALFEREAFFEPVEVDEERFKRPDFFPRFLSAETPICKVAQSPEDGAFVSVRLSDGQGFEFHLSNDSDIEVTVQLEAKDASGQTQGSLIVQLGPDENRRVSLILWAPKGSFASRKIQTVVRTHPSNKSGEYSLELSQRAVSQKGESAKAAQNMDCSESGCSLRLDKNKTSGDLGIDKGLPGAGPGGGPSGPH